MSSYRPMNRSTWQGRDDTVAEGARATRWHQHVREWAAAPGVAILGFACDEGVSRNGGRTGAAGGPQACRKAMANLAWHMTSPVYDAGDVVCSDTDLESAQSALGERVATLLTAKQLPLIIGGGHEVAWGTWQGISAVLPASARIGIINVDAHFDLRGGEQASSGTPFRQIANACAADGRLFRYSCLGVSAVSNTAALFETAKATGTVWMLDDDFSIWNRDGVERVVSQFVDSVDAIYLTLCLDAFPASIAPGVSAPAARGIEVAVVEALIDTLRESGLLIVAEVAELNPVFDQDSRTAKLAARLLVRCAGGGTISPA